MYLTVRLFLDTVPIICYATDMNETLTPTITTERVDGVPLLLAQMERMDLPALLDAHFPPHGNHQGLSLGWLCTIWWAEQLQETLASFLPAPLRPTDLTDDRLPMACAS